MVFLRAKKPGKNQRRHYGRRQDQKLQAQESKVFPLRFFKAIESRRNRNQHDEHGDQQRQRGDPKAKLGGNFEKGFDEKSRKQEHSGQSRNQHELDEKKIPDVNRYGGPGILRERAEARRQIIAVAAQVKDRI